MKNPRINNQEWTTHILPSPPPSPHHTVYVRLSDTSRFFCYKYNVLSFLQVPWSSYEYLLIVSDIYLMLILNENKQLKTFYHFFPSQLYIPTTLLSHICHFPPLEEFPPPFLAKDCWSQSLSFFCSCEYKGFDNIGW